MHSRVFVLNNVEITEDEIHDNIKICDYVVKENEENKKNSIEWLRETYLNQLSQDEFFDEKDIEIFIKKIKDRAFQRLLEIEKNIAEIRKEEKDNNGDFDLEFRFWKIKDLAYPESEFFFVIDDGYICNEIEFLSFLKDSNSFRITETFDYHY